MRREESREKAIVRVNIGSRKSLTIIGLVSFWLISLALVWYFSGYLGGGSEYIATKKFPLINPRLRNLTLEDRTKYAFTTLVPLREKLTEFLGGDEPIAAFYVEDLNTGAWSGIKEKEEFIPASLLKVPVAIGVMKKVDDKEWSLDKKFKIEEKYKDKNFGSLWEKPDGAELTLGELIKQMLQNSDNTASNILFMNLTNEERDNVYYHIGVINPEAPGESQNQVSFNNLTPRNLATFFRALYNATYLTRDSSNYLLGVMTKTEFDEDISTNIPSDIIVSHKMAAFYDQNLATTRNYHDCGITFLPNHPYLFCFLTRNLNPDRAQQIISGMGGIVFEYFMTNGKMNSQNEG